MKTLLFILFPLVLIYYAAKYIFIFLMYVFSYIMYIFSFKTTYLVLAGGFLAIGTIVIIIAIIEKIKN